MPEDHQESFLRPFGEEQDTPWQTGREPRLRREKRLPQDEAGERARMRKVKDTLAGWARMMPWAWFFSGTFRNRKMTVEGARMSLLRWLRSLPALCSPRLILWGIEGQRDGTPHVHALVMETRGLLYQELNESWFERNGIARAYPYNADLGAAFYITRYIVGDGNWDWGIYERGVEYGEGE